MVNDYPLLPKTPEILKFRHDFSNELQDDLAYTLTENLVTMSTSMVATIILLNRNSGVSEEKLLK